ncbi:MAG: DNA-binding protein [Nanoarchaeota archaeon]
MNDEVNEKLELQKQIQEIESIAKQYLNKDALIRYGNLKTAFPEKAIKIATFIVQLVNNNQITEKLDDEKFKFLLRQLEDKKEFRIVK